MKPLAFAAAGLCVLLTGCGVTFNADPGPVMSESKEVDAGKVEAVRAEIKMSAGELKLEGGAPKLLVANFKYSENLGRPDVRYDATGFRGNLTVESPKKSASGNVKNIWDLKRGPTVPIDLVITLGAGESKMDLSSMPLKSVSVQMGAGQIELNLAGKYTRDVEVNINGGVGQANIKLPKDVGVIANAKGGIGVVNVTGLEKRDGTYYNAAYAAGKPAIKLDVKGGVGEINMRVVD